MANMQGLKDIVKYFADNVADINIRDDDDLVSILCEYTLLRRDYVSDLSFIVRKGPFTLFYASGEYAI